jgi:hypothetical protein
MGSKVALREFDVTTQGKDDGTRHDIPVRSRGMQKELLQKDLASRPGIIMGN